MTQALKQIEQIDSITHNSLHLHVTGYIYNLLSIHETVILMKDDDQTHLQSRKCLFDPAQGR